MKTKIFTLNQREIFHKIEFPMDTIVLSSGNGTMIVAMPREFTKANAKDRILSIYVWDGTRWIYLKKAKNSYTETMWKFHIDQNRKRKEKQKVNYNSLMHHSRVKKKGSGGQRLSKFTGIVTDYECAKQTLWDFPRAFNVMWN